MITKNPMQLKAFIKKKAAEKNIVILIMQRILPLTMPVILSCILWTASQSRQKSKKRLPHISSYFLLMRQPLLLRKRLNIRCD